MTRNQQPELKKKCNQNNYDSYVQAIREKKMGIPYMKLGQPETKLVMMLPNHIFKQAFLARHVP